MFWIPSQKKLDRQYKKRKKIISQKVQGNGDTILIGREIQCLRYAGFLHYEHPMQFVYIPH